MKAFLYQELLANLLTHLKSECLTAKKKKSMLIALFKLKRMFTCCLLILYDKQMKKASELILLFYK